MRWLLAIAGLAASQPILAKDCAVVLHGLGRSSFSMSRIASALLRGGYLVVNESYRSRKASIVELSGVVGEGVRECRKLGADQIDFVTHSLGGILVRVYFQEHVVPEARRVVMLAPPNHGSEIADAFGKKWWYRYFTGRAGQELGTSSKGIVNSLTKIPLEIGIIAGTNSIDPWFASVMPKPNDGKVSVESSKLPEMQDFIAVPYTHTFMARRAAVITQVVHFLTNGTFNHDFADLAIPSPIVGGVKPNK